MWTLWFGGMPPELGLWPVSAMQPRLSGWPDDRSNGLGPPTTSIFEAYRWSRWRRSSRDRGERKRRPKRSRKRSPCTRPKATWFPPPPPARSLKTSNPSPRRPARSPPRPLVGLVAQTEATEALRLAPARESAALLAHPELVDQHAEQWVVLVVAHALGDEVEPLAIEQRNERRLVDERSVDLRPQLSCRGLIAHLQIEG